MSGLNDYLNLIVAKFGEILGSFNAKDFPEITINKIKESIAIVKDCEDNFPKIQIELKDTLIDLKNLLIRFIFSIQNFNKDFVAARKEFKKSCLKKFKDELIKSKWTNFKAFTDLENMSI